MIKINICGDFCVTEPYLNNDFFSEEIISFFKDGDLNILNLECPIIDNDASLKIEKTGPHLRTGKNIFPLLKKIIIKKKSDNNEKIKKIQSSSSNGKLLHKS